MTQLSHSCAHAARLGQSADTLRDLADRLAREDDMQAVDELLGDAVSALGRICQQHDAAMRCATEMHHSIRAVTVCHERREPITDSAAVSSPMGER